MRAFNPLTTSAAQLRDLLQSGHLTSVDIVDTYIAQIERHNHAGRKLNALISVAPLDLLQRTARALDQERRDGSVRSALHGIPIVVKDSIVTDAKLGMPTTNGSPAFWDATAMRSAEVVDRLVEAGMIVLGKANLTEGSGMKVPTSLYSSAGGPLAESCGSTDVFWCQSPEMLPGWSAAGGQTQSPYVAQSNIPGEPVVGNSRPGGSSAGSAVAVAAGFVPLALGTEAVGSVITPGNRAALYALKIAPGGDVSGDGVFGISTTFDGMGPMATSSVDLAALTAVVSGRQLSIEASPASTLSIGFVDPRKWKLPEGACNFTEADEKQMVDEYEDAVRRVQKTMKITYPVEVPQPETLKPVEGEDPYRAVAYHQCRDIFKNVAAMFENNSIHTVADMAKWNEEHADIALPKDTCPDQKDLIETLAVDADPEIWAALHARFRRLGGPEGVDPAFDSHDLDIIAAPADSALCSFAAAAGYPIGLVPMSTLKSNGRPFGMCMIAKKKGGETGEEIILRFMRHWEVLYPSRPLPAPMMDL